METRTRRPLLWGGALVALAIVGVIAYAFFLPENEQTVDQMLDAGSTAISSGAFSGADSVHHVSGTVALHRAADGSHFLRFEDYEATAGPDVYFFLARADADGYGDLESTGLRVRVPGGEEDGRATLRGNFNVPLPAGFSPAAWGEVAVWCDRFNVLFGSADLASGAT